MNTAQHNKTQYVWWLCFVSLTFSLVARRAGTPSLSTVKTTPVLVHPWRALISPQQENTFRKLGSRTECNIPSYKLVCNVYKPFLYNYFPSLPNSHSKNFLEVKRQFDEHVFFSFSTSFSLAPTWDLTYQFPQLPAVPPSYHKGSLGYSSVIPWQAAAWGGNAQQCAG